MAEEIEISGLDTRYESYRKKLPLEESRLLSSIAERGIEEPLEGVSREETNILLNGFKRYRCAKKLSIGVVPYLSMGEDEVSGITSLLSVPKNKALSALEQAGFIEELKNIYKMSIGEIAESLCRSKSWVSMRMGLVGEISPKIREHLMNGTFPEYSYMYTLRSFMRMNGVSIEDIEKFVEVVSGKKLSIREIEQLAHGYFRGTDSFREEVNGGNIIFPLRQMKQAAQMSDGCNEFERAMLKDLELIQKYMQQVVRKSESPKIETRAFHGQSHLITAGILSKIGTFKHCIKELHDRNGKA